MFRAEDSASPRALPPANTLRCRHPGRDMRPPTGDDPCFWLACPCVGDTLAPGLEESTGDVIALLGFYDVLQRAKAAKNSSAGIVFKTSEAVSQPLRAFPTP